MISVRAGIVLFIVSLVLFIVVLLPVSVILSLTNIKSRVAYSHVAGSLSHMSFTDLSVDGVYMGSLEFSPDFPEVLWGEVAGSVNFSGLDRQAEISFELDNTENLIIDHMTLLAPVTLETNVGQLSGVLRARSNGSVISLSRGCLSGDFDLVTTVFDNLFEQMSIPVLSISGQGVCGSNGMINVNLEGKSNALVLAISGEIDSDQNWSDPALALTAFVEPPEGGVFASDLEQLFLSAGLSRVGRRYRLLLETGKDGNR